MPDPITAENFANWLSTTLDNRDLAGNRVAEALGIHEGNITKWRRGQKTPSAKVAAKLAKYLGVDPGQMLVTAGLVDREDVPWEPFQVPAPSSKREAKIASIMAIPELDDDERRRMLGDINDD